jgi:ComF family protein
MTILKQVQHSISHLLYPNLCAGCGIGITGMHSSICIRCLHDLPSTGFEKFSDNPVEKLFWGRLNISQASSAFYFSKKSIIQELLHELKYRGNRSLGIQLGQIMGSKIQNAERFSPDVLVPIPLFPSRERKRGYNQAAVLCEGMSDILHIPVLNDVMSRPQFTATQTKKGRIERWKNIEGKFELLDSKKISDLHVLLVDDVVTTGATLESCGQEIMKAARNLAIAALCFTLK